LSTLDFILLKSDENIPKATPLDIPEYQM